MGKTWCSMPKSGESCEVRHAKTATEVFVVGPEDLDAEVKRLSPHLVVCSHAPPLVELRSLV